MALVRLDVRFDALDALVERGEHDDTSSSHSLTPTRSSPWDRCTIGSPSPLGVWLELSEDYSAQMAARDVATLSWLVALDTVVVSADDAEARAQVVEALLTNDEVNFTNGVATVVGCVQPAGAAGTGRGVELGRDVAATRRRGAARGLVRDVAADFDVTTYR